MYLGKIFLITVFTSVSAFPPSALAFEANLAHSPTPQLTAYVATSAKSADSYRSGTAVAVSDPITARAYWPQPQPAATRLAVLPAAVSNSPIVTLEGEASYYSRAGCLGCSPALRMANGQPLDDSRLTMAIGADKKHLVGRSARVTNLHTKQSVVVQITDTGGFYQAKYGHRVADLTIATKQAIGMNGGVGQVRVEVF